eukprot:6456749-Amphidinium_carterae.1
MADLRPPVRAAKRATFAPACRSRLQRCIQRPAMRMRRARTLVVRLLAQLLCVPSNMGEAMNSHFCAQTGSACWFSHSLMVLSASLIPRRTAARDPACCIWRSSTTPTKPTVGCWVDIRTCNDDMKQAASAVASGQPAVTATCTVKG